MLKNEIEKKKSIRKEGKKYESTFQTCGLDHESKIIS